MGLLACVGLAVRLQAWADGAAPDELGTVQPGDFLAVLLDPEAGVNPPVWRLLTNPWLPDWSSLRAGRVIALACGVAGIPAAGWLGWRAGGRSALAATLAAALVALHPVHVVWSTMFRVYTLAFLLMTLHLGLVGRWLERPEGRGRMAAVVATAAVLPWLHYVTVPWLVGVGLGAALVVPGARRLPLLYVPAALGTAPLAWAVLTQPDRRVEHLEPAASTLAKVLGTGLHAPSVVIGQGGRLLRALGGSGLSSQAWMAWLVVASLLLGLGAWRRLAPEARLAWLSTAAVGVAVLGLARIQYVRTPTAVFVLVGLAPWLGALPGVVPWRGAWRAVRMVAVAALLGLLGAALRVDLPAALAQARARDAWLEVLDGLIGTGSLPAPEGVLHLTPSYAASFLWFHATRLHPARHQARGPCRGAGSCFEAGPWVFRGVDGPDGLQGVVVSVDDHPSPVWDATCARLPSGAGWHAWRCGEEPTAATPGSLAPPAEEGGLSSSAPAPRR
ncbi:MAG: hypothetical protein H6732_19710 [Alphaproteobacteria bacterium]|nr:hypothetical protein [Alphaproteobacteria bacterium]